MEATQATKTDASSATTPRDEAEDICSNTEEHLSAAHMEGVKAELAELRDLKDTLESVGVEGNVRALHDIDQRIESLEEKLQTFYLMY